MVVAQKRRRTTPSRSTRTMKSKRHPVERIVRRVVKRGLQLLASKI